MVGLVLFDDDGWTRLTASPRIVCALAGTDALGQRSVLLAANGSGARAGPAVPSGMPGTSTPRHSVSDDVLRDPPPRPARPGREPLWRDVLGEHLRSVRHDRGETLAETAARAGVSPQYLSEVERGIKEPSSEMIAAVAGALDTTLVDLTTGVAERIRTRRAVAAAPSVATAVPQCRAAYALAA